MHLKFSQDLRSLLERLANESLSLADIMAETSERGFSLIIVLLVLPCLFPMPPGLTGPLGLGCLLLSMQMAVGRRSPWLPPRVAQYKFPRWFALQLLQKLKAVTRILEKFIRPRLLWLAENHQTWRLNGICIAWLTLLLMLPIPLTNPFPTLGILLLAVATLEADGLLMCFSYGITALVTLLFGLIFYALWQAPSLIPQLWR